MVKWLGKVRVRCLKSSRFNPDCADWGILGLLAVINVRGDLVVSWDARSANLGHAGCKSASAKVEPQGSSMYLVRG